MVNFPARGLSDKAPHIDTPVGSAPPGTSFNVRPFDPAEQRAGGAQRPGLVRAFDTQTCGGFPVQRMVSIATPAVLTGYTLGECVRVTTEWENRSSGTLAGLCWMLSPTPSMFRDFTDTAGSTPPTGSFACAWHPLITGTPPVRRAVFATTFTDAGSNGGAPTVRLKLIDELGTTLWAAALEDKEAGGALPGSPRELYVNHATIAAPTLGNAVVLVCVGAEAGAAVQGYLYVFRATDGTYLRRYDLGGWASEAQQAAVRPDGKVGVLYLGSAAAGTLQNGEPITEGGFAQFFRSAIMLFDVNTPGGTLDTTNPLLQRPFGPQLTPADPYFETTGGATISHLCFRFSEQLERAPRGCYPTSIAATADNGFLVTFTNKGWGPNILYPPTDSWGRYTTVCKVSSAGVKEWEADTDSIRRAISWDGGTTTYYNDIPSTGDPFASDPPSLFASAAHPTNERALYYVGGARNSGTSNGEDGHNIFGLDPFDGTILWRASIGGAGAAFSAGVSQGGLRVDPSDGNLLVVGRRSTTWDNATGQAPAHLWKVNSANGAFLWHYDLFNGDAGDTDAAACDAYSVDADATGRILYATDLLTA